MHAATEAVLRFFGYAHLQDGVAKAIAREYKELATHLADILPDDPETTVALRKLLESKDAAVRAALVGEGVIQ